MFGVFGEWNAPLPQWVDKFIDMRLMNECQARYYIVSNQREHIIANTLSDTKSSSSLYLLAYLGRHCDDPQLKRIVDVLFTMKDHPDTHMTALRCLAILGM